VLQEYLPEDYFKAVIRKLPDNDKIRKELEAGVEIPGCKLEERGKHLILK
jgi:Siphovirus Gp157